MTRSSAASPPCASMVCSMPANWLGFPLYRRRAAQPPTLTLLLRWKPPKPLKPAGGSPNDWRKKDRTNRGIDIVYPFRSGRPLGGATEKILMSCQSVRNADFQRGDRPKAPRESEQRRTAFFTEFRPHRELPRYKVTESIAGMRSRRIGLVQ